MYMYRNVNILEIETDFLSKRQHYNTVKQAVVCQSLLNSLQNIHDCLANGALHIR